MTPIHRRIAALGVATVAVLTIAACTETTPTDQAGAEAALCASLSAFGTSLQEFQDLDPSTASVEDVQAARDDVQEAWDGVKASTADIPEADEVAIDTAWQGVSDAVDEFSTEVPISEALVPVQEAAGEVEAAREEMRNGVGCE